MPLLSARGRYLLANLRSSSAAIPLTITTSFALALPLRLFSSSTSAAAQAGQTGQAQCTRYLVRKPSEMASRESPFPVVFVRAKGLGLEEEGEWKDWSAMFAERGYTSVEIDIVPPSSTASESENEGENESSNKPFRPMTTTLATQIRLLSIPFPPIVVAQGAGSALLAQAFVEDNPASGLVLIHPPPDEDPRPQSSTLTSSSTATPTNSKSVTGWKWPTFSYEPHFPLLIMSSQPGLQQLSTTHRLVREGGNGVSGQRGRGKGLEVGVLDGDYGQELNEKGRLDVERWMDRCGF
ncbi:hypothetical protein IAU59_005542 [Kwoniella sp. CBS 9459]